MVFEPSFLDNLSVILTVMFHVYLWTKAETCENTLFRHLIVLSGTYLFVPLMKTFLQDIFIKFYHCNIFVVLVKNMPFFLVQITYLFNLACLVVMKFGLR